MAAGTGVRRTVTVLLVLIGAVLILTIGRQFWLVDGESEAADPPELQRFGVVVFPQPQPIEPFTLVDQRGNEVSREDLQGQWTIAFLGYSRCPEDVCRELFDTLSRFAASAAATTATTPTFWFVTVDPERDDPASLRQYLDPMELQVRGIAGERDQLQSLARSLKGSFNHVNGQSAGEPAIEFSGHLGLIAPDATLVAIAQAPVDSEKLANAYRQLVVWYRD
jgi:protein SCO1/2